MTSARCVMVRKTRTAARTHQRDAVTTDTLREPYGYPTAAGVPHD